MPSKFAPVAAISATRSGSTDVLSDLEAGESPILLSDLPRHSFMPRGRKGKRLHWSVCFRWASAGKNGVTLETLQTPSGIITTKSSVLRFFARLSRDAGKSLATTPGRTRRAHARAERELDSAGIT